MKVYNELLKEISGVESLPDYQNPKNELDHEINYALAEMYANKGFRTYLENTVNQAIKSAALRCENERDMIFAKARILTLKELLVISRRAFEQLQKIKDKLKIKKE